MLRIAIGMLLILPLVAGRALGDEPALDGVVRSEFIYEEASFPECHATTLAETADGIVAAWFGGTHEKHPDVGIWFARRMDSGWTQPVEVANGVVSAEQRYPCWNPVLHATDDGKLHLFYKVGPSPSEWWGMLITSTDGGRTWSEPQRLPDGILGPIKNKAVQLDDGRLLCGSSTEHDGWRVHMEWTADGGRTWEKTEPLNDGQEFGAIQPAILKLASGELKILCRSRGVGKILEATSKDGGRTWSPLTATELPNPNSGIDAVTLRDGRHLLVYNHTPRGRTPLNLAISDDAVTWRMLGTLETEPGEYSYPAIIQSKDGNVHLTYTWKRKRPRYVELKLAEE